MRPSWGADRQRWLMALVFIAAWGHNSAQSADPVVTGIDPMSGSRNGGTRLTVYGQNFVNNFNINKDPNIGTYTKLVSAESEYECDLHEDGVTDIYATCYTRAMPEGQYEVRVTVNGQPVTEYCKQDNSKCIFKVLDSNTPKITKLTPRSGTPGTLLTAEGRLFTSRYGGNEFSQNNRLEKILKVIAVGQSCDLKNVTDDTFYGIQLYVDAYGNGDYGYFKCIPQNDYIGNYNLSFIVEGPFGRSMPDPTLLHVHTTGIGMYQMYTEITGLSAHNGSTQGGLELTVTGKYFDNTNSPVRVTIAGTVCDVQTPFTSTEIKCITSQQPSTSQTVYTGNRGLELTILNGTSSIDPTPNWSAGTVTHLDEGYHVTSGYGAHVIKMSGIFIAPECGSYKFYLKSKSTSKLTLNSLDGNSVQLSVVSASMNGDGAESETVVLEKGKSYSIAVMAGSTGDTEVEVAAFHYETRYLASQTGSARAEVQTLQFVTDINSEVQNLVLTHGKTVNGQSEVQVLSVSGDLSGKIVVGFQGVFTEPLVVSATFDKELAAALNKLPSLTGYTVTVTVTSSQPNEQVYTVTLPAILGNVPLFEAMPFDNSSHVTINVITATEGESTQEFFQLQFGGTVTKPISVNAAPSEVADALRETTSVRCPESLGDSSHQYLLNYETPVSWGDERVGSREPFCGYFSGKNPLLLYKRNLNSIGLAISSSSASMLCFAHLGPVTSVNLNVIYKNSPTDSTYTSGQVISFPVTVDYTLLDQWQYTCHDIYKVISTELSGKVDFRLDRMWISRDSTNDVYIDNVVLNRQATVSDTGAVLRMRMPQARLNGAIISKVQVSGAVGNYTVEICPYLCGNNFELISLASGTQISGSVAANSTEVTFQLGASGGDHVTLQIKRKLSASLPVGGFFTVTFNGATSQPIFVTPDLDLSDVRDHLSSIPGLGDVSLSYTGSCSAFDYTVTLTTLAGNQNQLMINSGNLTGTNVTARVITKVNGGLWYRPIPGDMLRTAHNSPQVSVFINDVPSACAAETDCSFVWSASRTPNIISITPNSGGQGQSVTISGNGFQTSGNVVTIGGAECAVTSAQQTSLICTVSGGPSGPQPVLVQVPGKGRASGSVNFTYTFLVTSISPASGSIEGGLTLTISGIGFTPNGLVTIGSQTCDVTFSTLTTIECTVPPALNAASGEVNVSVTQNGVPKISPVRFNYATTATPIITGLSPSSLKAWGGETITVTGSGFAGNVTVTVNGKLLQVTSSSDTQIVVLTPPLNPGSYPVRLLVHEKGLADIRTNAIENVTITLTVMEVVPSRGSLYGGTVLTVTGEGFGANSSLVTISVGRHACNVLNVSDTKVTCSIAYTGVTHTVTNQGVSKDYGQGYNFDPKQVLIPVGDCVLWKWTTPSFVTDISYAIRQTQTDISKTYLTGGFASPGDSTPNGNYKFCFTVPGTYFYWSGYVNPPANNIYLRGQVIVSQRESQVADVKVTVGGIEASYKTDSAHSSPVESGPCLPVTELINGCTLPSNPTPSSTSTFHFTFHECATPIVTSVDRNNASSLDAITLSGTGFGEDSCQNEVTYADVTPCVVTSSSATSLSFTIGTSGQQRVAVMEEFSLRVGNRGNALMAIATDTERRIVLLPVISKMEPGSGSLGGGLPLTISGSGFTPSIKDTQVSVGAIECRVQTATTTEVTCITPPSNTPKIADVTVVTFVGNTPLPVECRANNNCTFQYDNSSTPTLASINPTSVSAPSTTFTITGNGFGDSISDVIVTLGGAVCSVINVISTQITCTTENVPAGSHIPQVTVSRRGLALASSALAVTSQALITSVSPLQGSTHGGTEITLTGHGFKNTSTVTIDGSACAVKSETATNITCVTQGHTPGTMKIVVTSNGITYPGQDFTFSSSVTPSVTSISPSEGQAGDSVIISGSKFSTTSNDNLVTIGGVSAVVTTASESSLQVTIGNQKTGVFPVVVEVAGVGLSNPEVTFTYKLGSVTINPTRGTTSGGQKLTLTGSGFLPGATVVTVCDKKCSSFGDNQSASQFVCISPPSPGNQLTTCDVKVTVNNLTKVATPQYTYDPDVTPEITGVEPRRGGTAGGTVLTISGHGFGTTQANVDVTVGGVNCTVHQVTDVQITCETNGAPSGDTKVDVNVANFGSAIQTNANFRYIDVWSSPFTWGGENPPVEDDFVVITRNQILLLDTNTPRLSMLLIQGTLIFDEKDIELNANSIFITDGGKLQVGTEDQPFPENYTAIIKLHGHQRSRELPIYGAKVLAVRNGTLDLHGRPTPVTWTYLSATAEAGDTQISLTTPVNWRVGDEIVLPSTSHRHSQNESEVRVISGVSANGLTLTLRDPLNYKHVSIEHTFADGSTITLRGEVGLLSHNVKVQGAVNAEWSESIPACEAGFDTGEFSTQTCFLGRFGAETASDQFGAHILVHGPLTHSKAAVARLSYVEISHAGQAFRLGRYPVHFHLNGDMTGSYVRGLGIHNSFNRAVNIHGSQNLLVEHVVIYNIMGGAFFLEDGIEINNTFQYNLAVFVRPSSSLRNDDVTPAGFWVTNPNNIIIHNAVAGGSHFGYWYRMKDHPEGPSYDPSICPANVPIGRFENNTAHSLGWFGLWIFENYFPRQGGTCNSNAPTQVSIFKTLTAWNCEKGAETVNTGALQFKNFVLVNNEKAGWEGKLLTDVPQYDETNGPMIDGGIIVAHLNNILNQEGTRLCTDSALVLPYQNGLLVQGVKFYNFDRDVCVVFSFTRIIGTCSVFCGGFTYHTKGLYFENSKNKVRYAWESEGLFQDVDGTLTGSQGKYVIPTTPTLPPTRCTNNVTAMSIGSQPGSVCSSTVKFHRFSFNNIEPASLRAKAALFTNQYGTTSAPYALKRITHREGWMVILVDGECYDLTFENAEQITNVSYDGVYYQFDVGDTLCIRQSAVLPDRFFIDGAKDIPMSDPLPSPAEAKHGDWNYNETTGKITYYIKRTAIRKRSIITYDNDLKVKFRAYRCYYDKCQPPKDPTAVNAMPPNARYWSDTASWEWRKGGKPVAGDNVTIPSDQWLVIDEPVPKLNYLVIEGGVSANSDATLTFTLDVNYILIIGRLVIGWENERFNGSARIVLRGDRSTPSYPVDDGAPLGAKFIGVFGGLDLHGLEPDVKWTNLAVTAETGATSLTLETPVTWSAGDEILLTTTDRNPWHTETFRLTHVAGTVLTLNSSVQYRHLAHSEKLMSGPDLKMVARVALLTRNIVIEGGAYDTMETESFGARVIVGRTVYNSVSRSGFARVENVEFFHSGQEGYTESYDPRYSLSFVDVFNTAGTAFYSYVRNNVFHNCYSPAVGVFGVSNLTVSGNVIHHVVGKGIHIMSDKAQVVGNLIALTIWPGAYQSRSEGANIEYEGAIEGIESTNIILKNNIVAGCERAGYHLPGQMCDVSGNDVWSGNEAHSCLTGVVLFPGDTAVSTECVRYSGFKLWKNADWGLYTESFASQLITDILSAENGVGFYAIVIGPQSIYHQFEDKHVDVTNSVFIGRTNSYDCNLDALDNTDDNVKLSAASRSWSHGPCGMTGVSFAIFTSGTNLAPEKPFTFTMSYNAIKGVLKLSNVSFEHFKSDGVKSRDYAISTSEKVDDTHHPVLVRNLHLYDVELASKVYIHEPNLGKINPSDCVDMDCDGHKKAMVVDEDGSFFGTAGYAIPNSAFEWGGNPQRGLGDYRIPTVMLTADDGSIIQASVKAPYKGIYGTKNCTWRVDWNAYECHGYRYAMMMIESMDDDTETRRLSPVAVFSEGYVDLINGPEDHGWCTGYTCKKRLSTFTTIVPLEKRVDLFLTSTVPDRIRFLLLNVAENECVALSLWKSQPHRLDIYVDNQYIVPLNGYMASGRFFVRPEDYPNQYLPSLINKTMGDNYVATEKRTIYWIQCGTRPLEIRTAKVLIINFGLPAMTDDEFFGESIIRNLALFLSVPFNKVRVVNVVRETATSGRRKRATDVIYFTVEVGDVPGSSDSSNPVDLDMAAAKVINQIQLYGMDSVINATVLYTAVLEPSWNTSASNQGELTTIQRVGSLELTTHPVGGIEGRLFSVNAVLQVKDQNGKVVEKLGARDSSWQVKATLKSAGNGTGSLMGNTTVTFINGTAVFTDLAITRPGDEYIIEFRIVYPPEAANYSLETRKIVVQRRSIRALGEIITTERITNSSLRLRFKLADADTNATITNINWRGHTWTVSTAISRLGICLGRLEGQTSSTFDPSTGIAEITDLRLTSSGICPLNFSVTSDPAEYDLQSELYLTVMTQAQHQLFVEKTSEVELTLPITYDVTTAPYYAATVRNYFSNRSNLRVTSHKYREGSLIVTLTLESTTSGMNATIYGICNDITSGTTFVLGGQQVPLSTSFTVDGQAIDSVTCTPVNSNINNESGQILHPGIIAAIIIVSLLLVVLLSLLLLWRLKMYPKRKTFAVHNSDVKLKSSMAEDLLFTSPKSARGQPTPLPPVDTSFDLWLLDSSKARKARDELYNTTAGDSENVASNGHNAEPLVVAPMSDVSTQTSRTAFAGPK